MPAHKHEYSCIRHCSICTAKVHFNKQTFTQQAAERLVNYDTNLQISPVLENTFHILNNITVLCYNDTSSQVYCTKYRQVYYWHIDTIDRYIIGTKKQSTGILLAQRHNRHNCHRQI